VSSIHIEILGIDMKGILECECGFRSDEEWIFDGDKIRCDQCGKRYEINVNVSVELREIE